DGSGPRLLPARRPRGRARVLPLPRPALAGAAAELPPAASVLGAGRARLAAALLGDALEPPHRRLGAGARLAAGPDRQPGLLHRAGRPRRHPDGDDLRGPAVIAGAGAILPRLFAAIHHARAAPRRAGAQPGHLAPPESGRR